MRVFRSVGDLRLKESGALAQLLVGELFSLRLKLVDLRDQRTNRFQKAFVAAAKNFG